MLISCLHVDSKNSDELIIKFVKLIRFEDFSEQDQAQIKYDWKNIQNMIKSGKGSELSSSLTEILEANTKGPGGTVKRTRAYSYKSSFMNAIYDLHLNKIEPPPPIVKNSKSIEEKGFKAKIKIEEGINELIKVFTHSKEEIINNY